MGKLNAITELPLSKEESHLQYGKDYMNLNILNGVTTVQSIVPLAFGITEFIYDPEGK